MKVLSSKILKPNQKAILTSPTISYTQYDAIAIKFIPFEIPENPKNNYIFSSKNAVAAVLKKNTLKKETQLFCVGKKTANTLIQKGFTVTEIAKNAASLAALIIKKHGDKKFTFFCGDLKRDELSHALKEAKISLKEVIVYKTTLMYKKFSENFEALLFFSPSGVASFVKYNNFGNAKIFCIGSTTASEAKKYSHKVYTAKQPTIEDTLQLAKQHLC